MSLRDNPEWRELNSECRYHETQRDIHTLRIGEIHERIAEIEAEQEAIEDE